MTTILLILMLVACAVMVYGLVKFRAGKKWGKAVAGAVSVAAVVAVMGTGCARILDGTVNCVSSTFPTRETWQTVEDYGGLEITGTYKKDTDWFLTFYAERAGGQVSGHWSKLFTSYPVYYSRAKAWAKDGTIFFYLRSKCDTKCRSDLSVIEIGKLPPGRYRVCYQDPDGTAHFIKEIEIGKQDSSPDNGQLPKVEPVE